MTLDYFTPTLRTTHPCLCCVWNKQVAFRGFRCRSAYRSLLARRRRAATMLQAAERRKRAVVFAAGLKEQRASSWEQLWDDEGGSFYFYYKVHTTRVTVGAVGLKCGRLVVVVIGCPTHLLRLLPSIEEGCTMYFAQKNRSLKRKGKCNPSNNPTLPRYVPEKNVKTRLAGISAMGSSLVLLSN